MTMKRIVAWAISLFLGLVVTFFLFEFTPINIPFVRGGVFTAITVLLTAFAFSYVLDGIMGARLYDERGWHLGLFDPMGPLSRDDPAPPKDYQPIVSREERRKRGRK